MGLGFRDWGFRVFWGYGRNLASNGTSLVGCTPKQARNPSIPPLEKVPLVLRKDSSVCRHEEYPS